MEGGPERDLMVLFGLSGAPRDIPQVLNPSIVIVWTKLKVMGLRMLSVGQHLALLCPNLPIIRPRIVVSEELPEARNRYSWIG